jgi:hypothetical protein
MKKIVLFLIIGKALFISQIVAQEIIDFGKCQLKVTDIREITSFKGEQGIVKPSRRDAKLLEIKVEGTSDTKGVTAFYPQMFAALFIYRGALRVTPAIAIGIKFKDPLSGNNIENWFNAPGVSFTSKSEVGDSISVYVIVEVAKETTEFKIQGPGIIYSTKNK